MNMVRHYHQAMHLQFDPMVMQTVLNDCSPYVLRQNPTLICAKSNEYRSLIGLEVRQISAVFRFGWFCFWQ